MAVVVGGGPGVVGPASAPDLAQSPVAQEGPVEGGPVVAGRRGFDPCLVLRGCLRGTSLAAVGISRVRGGGRADGGIAPDL